MMDSELLLSKHEKAIENTKASIVITDRLGKIEYANPFFTQITGYEPHEYIGKSTSILKSGFHSEIFYNHLWETINSGKTWEGELYNVKKNGEFFWEEATISPVINEEREIINFVAVKTDITARKKNELLIEKSLALFKGADNIQMDDLIRISLEFSVELTGSELGFLFFVNEAHNKITLSAYHSKSGYHKIKDGDELSILTFNSAIIGSCIKEKKIFLNNCLEDSELCGVFPDNHRKLTRFMAVPLIISESTTAIIGVGNRISDYYESEANSLLSFAENIHSIIRRKQTEIELIKAKERAEESDRLKSAFLQNISHEIRTPLNAIVGFSHLMLNYNTTFDKLSRFAEIVETSSNNLIGIISDVLDVSQIEAGLLQPELVDFDLIRILNSLHHNFSHIAEERNINLILDIRLNVSEYFVNSDSEKLTRILFHLIDNAIKFTKKGSVIILCERNGKGTLISVTDTGIGISSEMQMKIFEPFRQLEYGPDRTFGGNGLGLTLVKKYCEMLNIELRFISEPAKGSCFSIILPSHIDKDSSDDYQQLTSGSILVAEDDFANFHYIRELLDGSGLRLLHAENGEEAVDFVRSEPSIDLVLMDVKLPLMDGLKAASVIKGMRPELPVIAQTGYATSENVIASESFFDDILHKPYKASVFRQKLLKYIPFF